MMPVEDAEHEALEMFEFNDAAKAMVAKAQAEAAARGPRHPEPARPGNGLGPEIEPVQVLKL